VEAAQHALSEWTKDPANSKVKYAQPADSVTITELSTTHPQALSAVETVPRITDKAITDEEVMGLNVQLHFSESDGSQTSEDSEIQASQEEHNKSCISHR